MSAMPPSQVLQEWIDGDASMEVIFDWAMVDKGHQEAVVETIGRGLEEPATTAAMLKQTEIDEIIDGGTIDGPFS